MKNEEQVITISTKTLFKVVAFVVGAWVLYFLRDLVFSFFIAVILASLIDPFATWCEKFKIPRAVGVLFIFGVLFGLVTLVISLLVPILIDQSAAFAGSFGHLLEVVQTRLQSLQISGAPIKVLEGEGVSLGQTLQNAGGELFSTVREALRSIFSFVFVFVLTFYLVIEDGIMKNFLEFVAPPKYRVKILELVRLMKDRLGKWLRGQMILSISIGILVYVGLTILGVPYAALLAVLAALLEAVPYIGPTIAALPAIFLALAQHPESVIPAIMVGGLFVVIQQIENHILVPKVMQKAVGINPIASIISIVMGVKLGGIVGGLIAIPAVTALYVCLEYFRNES